MRAYSQDLRERALAACERGEAVCSIAERLEVSESWVRRVRLRFERTHERGSRKMGGHLRSRLVPHRATIQDWIAQQPDLTLAELMGRLQRELNVEIRQTALWKQLNGWGLRFKKKRERARANPAGRDTGPG